MDRGCLFEGGVLGRSMGVLGIDMGGEAEFGSFSQGTAPVLALVVLFSVGAGVFSRRMLFPWLMDLFSKTERIDGKDLFAPRSLAWMIGLLILWQSLDWLFVNEPDVVWNADLMTRVMDLSLIHI